MHPQLYTITDSPPPRQQAGTQPIISKVDGRKREREQKRERERKRGEI